VLELSEATLGRGSAAARQRRMFGRRGQLTDVVDALIANTQGRPLPIDPPVEAPLARELLADYRPSGFDEAVSAQGSVLPHYGWMFRTLERLGPRGMVAAQSALATEQRARGVTFGDDGRLFPLDLVPRIVSAEDWQTLSAGLAQRVRALELFLRDVYGERAVVRDGIVPASVVDNAPGRHRNGEIMPTDVVRIAVAGIDLVRDAAEHWLVLEDNLRVPSGIGYSIMSRRLVRSVMSDLEPPSGVVGLEDVPGRLRAALLSATETGAPGHDEVALLSSGPSDSAFFEHELLARQMGVPVVTPRDLQVTDEGVYLVTVGGKVRLSALYRRMDEKELMSSRGADMRPLGRALAAAVAKGRVALLNALGNGIADDKLVYAYVPDMIRYYLGEEPLIDNVPTYPCVDDARRAEVLDRLAELVLKPVDGYGGTGIVIGPHAERSELTELEKQVRAEPAKWVAQDMVSLSTHPTFSGRRLEPRAVDLRAFVFQSQYGGTSHLDVVPAALSRVAPPGSLIVNSSRGGGAKDTWILR
jgi:carboxylate-amine ligase